MITSLSLRFITVSFYQKKTFPSTLISYLFEQKTKIVHAVVVANIPNDLSEDIASSDEDSPHIVIGNNLKYRFPIPDRDNGTVCSCTDTVGGKSQF